MWLKSIHYKSYIKPVITFLIILIVLGYSNVNAQIEASFEDIEIRGITTPKESFFGIQSAYNYGSNSITNQFLSSFYQGQYIDSSLKKSVFNKLASRNRVGGEYNFSVYGKISLGGIELWRNKYWFKMGARGMANLTYSDNLFKLIFDGNSQFAGQNIDLGKSALNVIQYQYITGGIEKAMGNDHNTTVGAGVSLIKGSDHFQIAIDRANLFTQEDGEYLDLDIAYSLKQTDSLNKGFAAFNGFGAGLDLYYRLQLQNQSQFNMSVSDIGFISWNGKSLQSTSDTTYHFEGIEISNIFELIDTSSTDQNLQDTIINGFLPTTEQKGYMSMLPTQIHLNYLHHIGSTKFYVTGGIKYIFNAAYFPKVYAGGAWYTPTFDIISSVSYGGQTNFSWDIRLRKTFLKTFEVYAGCNNFLGYMIPELTTSQGLFVSLNKYF